MFDADEITDLRSLLETLEKRIGTPEERKAFDEAVWAKCGTEGAVLATDLSGFTRLTRAYGVLHFLAIFRRCQRLCVPLINKHGGSLLKQEADDLIGLFVDPESAILAAIDMLRVCEGSNQGVGDHDDHLRLCIGIDYGTFLKLTDDAFGDPVNVAYKLGEDMAEPGEILVGQRAFEKARANGLDLAGIQVEGPISETAGGVNLVHYSLRLAKP